MRHVFLTLLLGSSCLPAFSQEIIYQPLNNNPASGRTVEAPKSIKPGAQLRINFGNYNRFKYKSAVQTSYFYREFSGTVASTTPASATLVPKDTSTEGEKQAFTFQEKIAAANAALTTLSKLKKEYLAYRKLVGEVSKMYGQDYWPDDPTAPLAQLANTAFGPGYHSLSAGDFVDQLSQWQQELAQAQNAYKEQVNGLASQLQRATESLAFHKKRVSAPTATQRQGILNAQNAAQNNLVKVQQANQDYTARRTETTDADQVQAEITRWLAREAKTPVLPILAAAYVALRDAQPGPVQEFLSIPYDKDELDLELKLLLRDDYHAPPGSTLVPAPVPYKTTLFLVPRFRITASVGPYVGWLFDHQYVLADDSLQLAGGTYGKRRRIVRDNSDQHFEYIGATVLTHFEYRFAPSWGAALSLGAGVQAAGFRALVGPSLLFGNGQRGVLTGGLVLGQVKRLSSLYQEDEKIPVNVQTVPTREVNAANWFVALTYNLRSERK